MLALATVSLVGAGANLRLPKNNVKKHLKKLRGTCVPSAICPNDIDRGGFEITKPGVYCLAKPTSFTPENQNLAAISINVPGAGDVVIDLNGNTLSQDNTTANTNGIVVNGQTNVIIRNGSISNFTNNGILVQNNGGTLSDQIILEDLNIFQCGTAGTSQVVNAGVGGIVILNSTNISLDNVNARENFGVGVGLSGVNNFFMNDSHCDFTQAANFGSPFFLTAIGFSAIVDGPFILFGQKDPQKTLSARSNPFINPSNNLFITNCSFNGATAPNSAFGAIAGNLTTPPTTPPTPSQNRARNIIFENCVANDISTTAPFFPLGFAEGITVSADNVLIKNCVVDNLSNSATGPINHIVGLEVAVSTNATIEGCTVSNVYGQALYVNAFDIEGFGTNITFKNNGAYNVLNTLTTNTVIPASYAAGFATEKNLEVGYTFLGQGVVVDSCIAQNVHAQNPAITTAAGIFVSGEQNILVQNCVANNNDIGILVSDYIASTISPGATLITQNSIFANNVVENNLIAGFWDQTDPVVTPPPMPPVPPVSNNAYYGNSARSNGPSGLFNYKGTIFPTPPTAVGCTRCNPVAGTTPIRLWDVKTKSLCPCNSNGVMGDKLDNLDIRP